MAQGDTSQTHHDTGLGGFTQIRPTIYIGDGVNRDDLSVPAEVSKNGLRQDFEIASHTVIISDLELAHARASFRVLDDAAKLNNISLLTAFSNASRSVYGAETVSTPSQKQSAGMRGIIQVYATGDTVGPYAASINENGGGIAFFYAKDSMSRDKFAVGLAGIDSLDQLNAPQAYLDALGSYVAGHELTHLQDNRSAAVTTTSPERLNREIEGDFKILRSHFNKEFTDFVMDLRALGSLNKSSSNDVHATQIWSEEYDEGNLPDESEGWKIVDAPGAINNRAGEILSQISNLAEKQPGEFSSGLNMNLWNVSGRYGAYKAIREKGGFDDIPYANEFVDKYIAAAERRYTPDVLTAANLTGYREALSSLLEENGLKNLNDGLGKITTPSLESFLAVPKALPQP